MSGISEPPDPSTTDERVDALAGIRVVDISNFLAGPLVSMHLGDFGAEVIKVERPDGGDELRMWGNAKDGVGLYFKVVNRNKKCITADLRTPFGADIVRRLAADADVLVENFRTGTLERWGLGYEALAELNPRLVVVRVTGFGQTGPYRERAGFGTLAEAFSGLAYVSGFPDRPPLLPPFGMADGLTGLHAAFLVLVALRAREQTGRGQLIDLAIYEPLHALLGPQVVDFDQLGIVQEREGSRLPFTSPRNTYRTSDDRWVAISGSGQAVFERLCAAVGRPDIPSDPRFADNRTRLEHGDALDRLLQEAIGLLTLERLLEVCEAHGAAVAPVYSVADTFTDPQYMARGNVVAVEDDELGMVRFQNVVGKLGDTPGAIHHAGPRLGEHNDEILVGQLGLSPDELEAAGLPVSRPA